jgi:hypothetical protein
MNTDDMNEVEKTAYAYGRNVALRERVAHGPLQAFERYNKTCLELWHKLQELGAYADADASEFKPEYREFYYAGMDTVSLNRRY